MSTRRQKNFEDTFIRFDTIHERDGGHTHTHRQTAHYGIGRGALMHSIGGKKSALLILHQTQKMQALIATLCNTTELTQRLRQDGAICLSFIRSVILSVCTITGKVICRFQRNFEL